MSREWLILTRHAPFDARRDPLADPLDSEEWQGLSWVLPLLARLGSLHQKRAGKVAMDRSERLTLRPAHRS